MSTRVVRMERLLFSYLNILATNYLLLYSPGSPGRADYGTNVRPTPGVPFSPFALNTAPTTKASRPASYLDGESHVFA
jgi:hypothetical protein